MGLPRELRPYHLVFWESKHHCHSHINFFFFNPQYVNTSQKFPVNPQAATEAADQNARDKVDAFMRDTVYVMRRGSRDFQIIVFVPA